MKKLITACALAMLACAPLPAIAQDNAAAVAELQAMQKAAKADKRALVAQTLQLTDAEAKKFWPVYDSFQRTLANITRERNVALEGLVARGRPLTDAYAKQMVNELMFNEEQEIKALRKLANASLRALPPRKAARYIQLEMKLRAAQDYEIALVFPLAR